MTVTVLDRSCTTAQLGPSFRHRQVGPENELVDWFLDNLPIRVPRGSHATVFREPRLQSGFPDVVITIWNVKTTESWSPKRAHLTDRDIRVMHHIGQRGACSLSELQLLFSDRIAPCIERLLAAEMVRPRKDIWVARSLAKAFAVRRIIAIEAKMSDWTVALEQAHLNTWFASESYVLLPHVGRREKVVAEASAAGIGIWSREDGKVHPALSEPTPMPRSYASWLFNEWAWRAHATGTS
jgi:hypothetical protein